MAWVMAAGSKAIKSTRAYRMHQWNLEKVHTNSHVWINLVSQLLFLWIGTQSIRKRGKVRNPHAQDSKHGERGHVIVQVQLQIIE